MTILSRDTMASAEAMEIDIVRAMPVWRRIQLVAELSKAVRVLAYGGLRRRFPHASSAELRRRLLEQQLAPRDVLRVYDAWTMADDRTGYEDIMQDSNPIATLLLVTETLERLGIPYLIGGSFASSAHGLYRTTKDIDIVADIKEHQVALFVDALQDVFYADGESIRDAIAHQESFNLIHYASGLKIDIFVFKGRPFDNAQFARRIAQVLTDAPERSAYIASAEDTVLAKLEWYRSGNESSERQWSDIVGVLKLQADDLDRNYLRGWAARLGLSDLLQRALAAAGTSTSDGS